MDMTMEMTVKQFEDANGMTFTDVVLDEEPESMEQSEWGE